MARQSRRHFLKTAAAAATITIAGTKSSGRVLGANEEIRLAVAGLNGRGGAHISEFVGMQGVRITHLVDPDTRTHEPKIRVIRQRAGGAAPTTNQDIRRTLEDRNVDAVSIATPNHWHSLMTIWAAQAGKHVYVEKPMSHNVKEGRIAVDVARRHNVIVQHGTQSRSGNWNDTIELIHSGRYGRLLVSRALCYKRRNTIGRRPETAAPQQVNFDIWLGPARQQQHHANLVHYNWHWFWDFGNGDIGNQGVHQMDIARWAIRGATLPRSVMSLGGRYGYSDQGETPNTQVAVLDYGPSLLIFEVRGLQSDNYRGQGIGNVFHLEEGVIAGNRFHPRNGGAAEPLPRPEVARERRPGGGNHFANFIAAVRSRRTQDLNADVLEGHYSSAACHLANVSYRLGRELPFNEREPFFRDNRDAGETVERMQQHLTQGHNLNLANLTCRVGPKLDIDVRTETVLGNAEANRLLFREYRAPYVVPERVG